MSFLVLLIGLAQADDPDCESAFGQVACGWDCEAAFGEIACGYDCVSAYGQVKCAGTPEGRCEASFGEVVCWDPPPPSYVLVPAPLSPVAPSAAEARCVTAYGMTACGYDCTAAFGQLRCARTPFGRCDAGFGQVTCWDPSR